MRLVVAVAIEKGGAGKTTTVGNIAAALAAGRPKRRVLCVDWDPQANLTRWLLPELPPGAHIGNVIARTLPLQDAVHTTPWGFDVLAGHQDLAGRTLDIMHEQETAQYRLREVLDSVRAGYDVVLVDCPPKLDILVVNALAAADALVIPMELSIFGADGLRNTQAAVKRAQQYLNPNLKLAGLVANRADLRTRHQEAVLNAMAAYARSQDIHLFEPAIPESVVLPEACYAHVPVRWYKTRNPMARACADAYGRIAQALLAVLKEAGVA